MLTLDPLQRKKPAPPPEKQQEKRSIGIGLICTILFHVLLLCIAPFFPAESLTGSHSNLEALRNAQKKEFNFELEPATTEEQPRNAPFRFVETNPDAPDNTPDKTNNVSDRNQQSAQQEKPPEIDPENRPSTQGREDVQGGAIVSGNRAPPQPGAPAVPLDQALEEMVPQQAKQEQAQRAEQVPLSGFEKITGDNPEGIGTNVSQQKAPTTNAEQFQEGARDVKDLSGTAAQPQQAQQPKMVPRERPRLASASTARQSPISNRLAGTMNVGPVGIDARWSAYGQYMAQLIETVDGHFQRITSEYRGHIPAGTRVVVTFSLNSDGEVSVTQVEETAGRVAVSQCQSAITAGMPYPKWSPEMIAVLGDKQTITFAFYYY